MAETITKPGAGSLVTWHDGANDPAPTDSELRNSGYWEIEMVPGTVVRIHLIFGNAAPGADYTAAHIGSLFIDMTAGKLYIKTDAADTWACVGDQTA